MIPNRKLRLLVVLVREELVKEAVVRRAPARDRPVGVEFDGGVDARGC